MGGWVGRVKITNIIYARPRGTRFTSGDVRGTHPGLVPGIGLEVTVHGETYKGFLMHRPRNTGKPGTYKSSQDPGRPGETHLHLRGMEKLSHSITILQRRGV
jgi:hypothetical protein